jgi:hypothetical protein
MTNMSNHTALLVIAALMALNILGVLVNVYAFVRNRRRLKRVQARERRLDAGPITAAVGAFTRLAQE